jgi:quercetin dioxygenase-like cupin family protein
MFVRHLASHAVFSPDKMGKVTLAQGASLLAGLNCFEPGQEHKLHAHAGQDKLYVVLEGTGEAVIGTETQPLSAGDAAFAPADVPHGMRNTGTGRLVVMVVLAPPPGAK